MTDHQLYCRIADCEDPNNPGFPRPSFRDGVCSSHTKQLQRTGKTTVIAEKLPLNEQLIDAYSLYAEADTDEDETKFKRRFFALAKNVGRREIGAAIREGMKRAKEAGKTFGPRPKIEPTEVLATFSDALDVINNVNKAAEIAARRHHVSRATVFRYLAVSRGKLLRLEEKPRPRRAG